MRFSIAIFLAVPVRVINDYARRHTILALVNINKPFPNFQNVAIGYVNTRKYFISIDCSFKASKFAAEVRVVTVVSTWTSWQRHRDQMSLNREKVVKDGIALLYLYLFHFKNKNLWEKIL